MGWDHGDDQNDSRFSDAASRCGAECACGVSKFACVAESAGTPSNKLGQTLADIVGNLTSGLAAYDAMGLTPWTFSPIAPLLDCP